METASLKFEFAALGFDTGPFLGRLRSLGP
jgi:hypothetical protein